MYESFYGLTAKPFSLLPDADFLYLSTRHRRAVNMLEYGLLSQAGFVVITGEVGAGKTTIIRRFLRSQRTKGMTVGVVTNATAAAGGLMQWIALAFELDHQGRDHISLYNKFVDFAVAQYGEGKRILLIVDEAQNLSIPMLEDLRMLSNINNEKDLILQIVLIGQPELLNTLKLPALRQFAQRINVHHHLSPISAEETRHYIRHRLSVAGGDPMLFDDLACAAVYHFSSGVPRLINLLCDQAMVYAFADALPRVTFDLIFDAVADRSAGGLSPFDGTTQNDRDTLRTRLTSDCATPPRDKGEPALITIAEAEAYD